MEDGDDTSKDVIRQIVVPGGKSTGSSKAVFDDLRRGTYTVTEAVSDAYMVKEIEVLGTTNCLSVPEAGKKAEEITFTMGNNTANENVIGRFTEDEQYTSYIDPVNGVYGAAEFTMWIMLLVNSSSLRRYFGAFASPDLYFLKSK